MLEVLFFNLQCNYDKASLAKSIPKFYTECLVAPCKCFQIPESTKFSLLKSRILGFGTRNPADDWNSESNRKQMESSPFGNLEFTELEFGIQYPESGTTMRNAESNTVMDSLTRGESYWGVKIYKQKQVSASSQILDQIIWNNKFLKIGVKSLYWRVLVNKGVVRVKGLFDTGGKLHKWNTLYATISHKLNILF